MSESAATLNPYVVYSILGFIALVGTVMMGAVLRLMFLVGRMDGRLTGLESSVADLRQDNANLRQDNVNLRQEMTNLRQEMTNLRQGTHQEFSNIWQQLSDLREQVAENRGLLLGIHQRIDLLMGHRHDADTGNVVITTTTDPQPQPVAD